MIDFHDITVLEVESTSSAFPFLLFEKICFLRYQHGVILKSSCPVVPVPIIWTCIPPYLPMSFNGDVGVLYQCGFFCGKYPFSAISGVPIFLGVVSHPFSWVVPSHPVIELIPENVIHGAEGCFAYLRPIVVRPSFKDGVEFCYDVVLRMPSQPSDGFFHFSHMLLLAFFTRLDERFEA